MTESAEGERLGVPAVVASPRVPFPGASESPHDQELSLLQLGVVLAKHWTLAVGFPLGSCILVGILLLLVAPTFTATTSFVPEANRQPLLPGNLAGLAGQFGLSLGAEPSQSPRFYADVAKSREILERVLLTRYAVSGSANSAPDSATLLQWLPVRGRDLADSLERGRKKLRKRLSVRVDMQTNIVSLSVDAKDPLLASQIANRFIEYLNDFNAKTRQSQARERRKFIEERVQQGEQDLRDAEEGLKTFYQRNYQWQESPQLVFEEGRLRRRVELQQELYLTLRREYETARIEEVNDTPVLTVIDPAVPPHKKSAPDTLLLLVLTAVVGTTIGVAAAFGAEYIGRLRRGNAREYQELREALHHIRDTISGARRRAARREER